MDGASLQDGLNLTPFLQTPKTGTCAARLLESNSLTLLFKCRFHPPPFFHQPTLLLHSPVPLSPSQCAPGGRRDGEKTKAGMEVAATERFHLLSAGLLHHRGVGGWGGGASRCADFCLLFCFIPSLSHTRNSSASATHTPSPRGVMGHSRCGG